MESSGHDERQARQQEVPQRKWKSNQQGKQRMPVVTGRFEQLPYQVAKFV